MKNREKTNYESRKERETLKKNKGKYEILIQTIPDIIYELDVKGRFTFVSNAIKELGYNSEELVGRHFSKIIHPDDLKIASRILVLPKYKRKVTGDANSPKLFDERRTGSRMTKNLEIRLLLKNQKGSSINYCYVEVSSSGKWDRPVKYKNKKFHGTIGIIKDITKRKMTEVRLRESEEFSFSLLNNSPHPMLVVNPDTSIRYVNPALQQLTGFSPEELFSKKVPYPWWSKKTLEQYYKDFEKTMQKGVQRTEELFRKKNGEEFWVETTFTPIKNKRKFKYWLVNWIDITERKKVGGKLQTAYTKLRKTQDLLIQAEKMEVVGRMAGGVAHEVKNPLAIILQGVNYLEGKIPLRQRDNFEIVQMMKHNIKRADNIIRVLIDFSRETELEIKPEDINSILENSLVLIQPKIKLEAIKVVKEMKEDLSKVLVDKSKIEQVFVNIFLNAVQAMPKGGKLFIRTYQTRVDKMGFRVGRRKNNGDYFRPGETSVVAEIEDTGIGVSHENIRKVFDPFFTTKQPKNGTGLGLTVTKNIIDMHKGIIEMKSKIGKGTKVIIKLKITKGA